MYPERVSKNKSIKKRGSWSAAWAYHWSELAGSFFAGVMYLLIAENVEPSRYTFGLLLVAIFGSLLFVFRMIYTVYIKQPEDEKQNNSH
jgi:hypothetical protein